MELTKLYCGKILLDFIRINEYNGGDQNTESGVMNANDFMTITQAAEKWEVFQLSV